MSTSTPMRTPKQTFAHRRLLRIGLRYFAAITVCAMTALIATPIAPQIDLANVMLLFLLATVWVAWKLGRGPAVLAAFFSVALFDYFFVPPRLTFAVADTQYIITFIVLLAVALIIGQLTAKLRHETSEGLRREASLRTLYEMARDLSAALRTEEIIAIGQRFIEQSFGTRSAVLLADEAGNIHQPASDGLVVDLDAARFTFDYDSPMGGHTADSVLYLPLRAPMRNRGVVALEVNPNAPLRPEQRRQLDSLVALIATALERVHYIEVAQDAIINMESERLRNSVLAALSHDLRTPLTALVGTAESLLYGKSALAEQQRDLAQSIRDQAYRVNSLVENLLDMARLQSGKVKLKRRWQPIEEVIGSTLRAHESLLSHHRIKLSLAADLPPLEFDALLLERVFANLLENAAKYTPAGSVIEINARCEGNEAILSISDNGPGLAPGSEQTIFEKFTRGARESATPGVGLGLAISRAIVEAHHGRIWAENVPGGGARFSFSLPLGTPPNLQEDEAAEEHPHE